MTGPRFNLTRGLYSLPQTMSGDELKTDAVGRVFFLNWSSLRIRYTQIEIQEIKMDSGPPKSTVFFDGSCSLCRAEIEYYQRTDQDRTLCFVEISEAGAVLPEGVTQERAMKRFHVRSSDGRVLSGAAAFVEIWTGLPGWRWAARVASLPGALAALEWGYRSFLPVRPFISRLFGRVLRLRAAIGEAKRR